MVVPLHRAKLLLLRQALLVLERFVSPCSAAHFQRRPALESDEEAPADWSDEEPVQSRATTLRSVRARRPVLEDEPSGSEEEEDEDEAIALAAKPLNTVKRKRGASENEPLHPPARAATKPSRAKTKRERDVVVEEEEAEPEEEAPRRGARRAPKRVKAGK